MRVARKIVSLLPACVAACLLLAACHGSSSTSSSAPPPTVAYNWMLPAAWVPGQNSAGVQVPGVYAITFTSQSTDYDNSNPSSYLWNFGDGTTVSLTTATVTHNYVAPGNYIATLTVTDDHGVSASKAQTVNVPTSGAPQLSIENLTWVNGADTINSVGKYETAISGTSGNQPKNQPSARQNAVSWVNKAQGKLWLFGGSGVDSNGTAGVLNDLWVYDIAPACTSTSPQAPPNCSPTASQWLWVGGSNKVNASGIYGASNTAASSNVPGARTGAASWTDANGNFWLFGGSGFDINGTYGSLNDLWELNPLTGEATWVAGSSTVNSTGTTTMPSARTNAVTWTANGNLWLFGGNGYASNGTGLLNDLWMFNPSTLQWTLIGQQATANAPTSSTSPGGRLSAQAWTDNSGKLWMYGGNGYDLNNIVGALSDMWMFDPAPACTAPATPQGCTATGGLWASIVASSVAPSTNSAPVYPSPPSSSGSFASNNTPGARMGSVTWLDQSGILWLFGGLYNTAGITAVAAGGYQLGDLWAFNTTKKQWAWMGGSTTAASAGIYATNAGTPSGFNAPGARLWSTGWFDASGNLWLFGGAGADVTGTFGNLNDLWEIQLVQPPK